MNRLGIHISLFQLFVISTTHFSSPALHSVFYVRWNPRNSHILGRERQKAEITVTLRKSLNLAGPLYFPSCGGSGSEPDPRSIVFRCGGREGVRAQLVEDALVRSQPGNVSFAISITKDIKEG